MLEREDAFYLAHQAEFQEKYLDKWLVIAGEDLFGVFDTIKDAFLATQDRFKEGEFMLHRPADDGTVIEIGPIIDDGKKADGVMTVTDGELMIVTYA
ncbi:MAG: hypothetical protein LBS37_06955 [Treponema sp.]|jgi:hypothetical protein|nr:hypothetical protein [Treponema sp.]